MSTRLIITRCSDSLMWYRNQIGKVVPIVRNLPDEKCWLSREPSGMTNIVRYRDAAVVPSGWSAAANDTHFQQGDMIFLAGQWRLTGLDLIGSPIGNHIVIRKEPT